MGVKFLQSRIEIALERSQPFATDVPTAPVLKVLFAPITSENAVLFSIRSTWTNSRWLGNLDALAFGRVSVFRQRGITSTCHQYCFV